MKKVGVEKVLFVISNISFGGAQRVTWTLAEQIKRTGVDAVVVAIGHSTNNYTLPEGLKVVCLGQRHSYEALSTIKRLKRAIIEEKPTVIITMGVSTCLYSVPAVKGTRIPHIISERNDPRHFSGKRIVGWLSRLLMRSAEGFVFQTEDARDFYPDKLRRRGRIIPNPIMAKKLPDADRENELPAIVTMGRLTSQKNHRLLIDSFSELASLYPEYRLHIWGSGELRGETEDHIRRSRVPERITLHEACDDVLEKIKNAAMFVLSSDFEGMPNALMEAMAMGLPCISTDCPCGGPRFLIKQRENGILVPVGDKDAMASAMVELARSREWRDEIGSEAKKIRTSLSADSVCRMWLDFCEEVVNG